MSATAGSGAERRMEERARAAEKAWSDEADLSEEEGLLEEHTINDLDEALGITWVSSFGFKIDFERLVGIVRDIMGISFLLLFDFLVYFFADDEEREEGEGSVLVF